MFLGEVGVPKRRAHQPLVDLAVGVNEKNRGDPLNAQAS